jgi:glycosyltransferase involved in cell wall biosynthesis
VDTETTEQEDKDLSHGGTANTEKLGKEAGLRPGSRAGAAFSNPSASKLARDSENTSLNRSKIAPASDAALDSRPSTLDCKAPATSYPLPATPASPDVVFLAFGQIRDGKNLDLFLRAMTRLPENVKLFVAGKGDSGSSRPAEYYQKLAQELGVAKRCRWDIRRIPDEEVGGIFAACDVVLVTYSAKFRSASGVLNTAVSARKPVLASSGLGPLKTVVNQYQLGIFVEPDDFDKILRAASDLANRDQLHAAPAPAWDRYESENSWEENARKVVEVFEA